MSNTNNTYNGWANYATWRVYLEMFDGGGFDGWDPDAFKQQAEDYIEETSVEGPARDYAMAFLSDVNWFEIAKHYAEEE